MESDGGADYCVRLDLDVSDVTGAETFPCLDVDAARELAADLVTAADAADNLFRERAAHIIPRLLDVSPSLRDRWPRYLASWDGQSEGDYIDMSEVADHLVEQLRAGDTAEFDDVFAEVERLLAAGDAVVEAVITVGLLENLQNVSADRGGPELVRRFRPWLGARTSAKWDYAASRTGHT